jgi:glycosyltransferase involved in cell wall biosynthesis
VIVGLDTQLAVGTATGIGVYQRGLLAALRTRGVDVRALAEPRLDPWRFDRRVAWDQVLLPLAARRARSSVLHCTSGTMPLVAGMPVVVTVHDVAWLRVQDHVRAYARWYFGRYQAARYRSARVVLVDSAFSRDEYLALVGGDPALVRVAYPGVDPVFHGLVRMPAAEPVILCVGTVEKRKNLAIVIEALAQVPEARLVVVGPPTPYLDLCRNRAAELGVADRIAFRGFVSTAELHALYATAWAAVVPSRYEGFGYGAAQAMCAGVPVLAGRGSSLTEVVADPASLLDPDAADAWSAALRAIVAAPEAAFARANERRDASFARFGWAAAAVIAETAYADALR